MRNYFVLALSFLASVCSLSAVAENFYWSHESLTSRYDSPRDACEAWFSSLSSATQSSQGPLVVSRFSDTLFRCALTYGTSTWAIRSGDACDGDYNQETGECKQADPEPDLCAASAGSETPFTKSGKAGDGWYSKAGNGIGTHPDQACRLGCLTTVSKVHCTDSVDGSYQCSGWQYGAGVKCPDGAGGYENEQTDQFVAPEPQTIVDKKPCVYETLANGTQQCKSESSVENEGENCGSFNGEYKCLPKAATKNGIEIATSVKTDPTADGGSKTTKTDVTTKTECKNGTCTTSTTTRTTTTTRDANGNTTSVGGSCKGANCSSANEDPDGTGSGGGICTGTTCSDDTFGGDGDGSGTGPELEEVDDYGDTISGYFQRIGNSPIIASVQSISIPSGGSCPVYTETIIYVGTLSTQSACQFAAELLTPLRALFLAIWAWAAVRVFMSA